MLDQLDEFRQGARLDDSLEAILAIVCHVGKRPADIADNLSGLVFDEDLRQRDEGQLDLVEWRYWTASAEVGKSPGYVAAERGAGRGSHHQLGDGFDSAACDDNISDVNVIAGQIAQCPYSLLNHFQALAAEELD